ncbi:type III-A CRISPR-associated RAMP protein Csm3 [Thermovibrio sp.]
MAVKEFKGNLVISYRLKVESGLHIGGSKEHFEIGGLDNPVIKLPEDISPMDITSAFDEKKLKVIGGQPYIPGSSLKGKLRALLEIAYGDFQVKDGETVERQLLEKVEDKDNKENKLVWKDDIPNLEEIKKLRKLFGMSPVKEDEVKVFVEEGLFPVRGRFFDAYPVGEEVETEVKYENKIDRITSKANPRPYERVPVGTEFEGKIVIRVFDESDVELLKLLEEAFNLLEDDYLGGGGSRGSGRVKLERVKVEWRSVDSYRSEGVTRSPWKSFDEAYHNLKQILRGNQGAGV